MNMRKHWLSWCRDTQNCLIKQTNNLKKSNWNESSGIWKCSDAVDVVPFGPWGQHLAIVHPLMPQSHCHESTGDSVRILAICAIWMWVRIMENKNAPEVNNLLNNEPTRINTVQIAAGTTVGTQLGIWYEFTSVSVRHHNSRRWD